MTTSPHFLDDVVPRLVAADTALHNGDPEPRRAMGSQQEPTSLYDVAISTCGWDHISEVSGRLGEQFSDCTAFDCEVVAGGASGDLGYLVAIERVTLSMGQGPPQTIVLG